jgi:hypothetical protein
MSRRVRRAYLITTETNRLEVTPPAAATILTNSNRQGRRTAEGPVTTSTNPSCRPPSGLANEAATTEDEPHPPVELVTIATTPQPGSSSPAVPPPCPKHRSAAVIHGQPRSVPCALQAAGSAIQMRSDGASQARGGPRAGRSWAVNGRSASDNYGESRASSVQLSGSFWPSTAGHGLSRFALTRKGSQVQTLSRPPTIDAGQAGCEHPAWCIRSRTPPPRAANGQQPRENRGQASWRGDLPEKYKRPLDQSDKPISNHHRLSHPRTCNRMMPCAVTRCVLEVFGELDSVRLMQEDRGSCGPAKGGSWTN